MMTFCPADAVDSGTYRLTPNIQISGVNILERMLAGEFGAVEYVRAMLERNKEVAQLNAVICLDEDRLLEAAARRDRQRQAGGRRLAVGVCLEGSAGSDRKILAIGKALQDEVGFLPRPGIRAKGEGIEFRPHSTKQ